MLCGVSEEEIAADYFKRIGVSDEACERLKKKLKE